jgi:predicted metalloendopeptidase
MYKNRLITLFALILAACSKPQPAAEAPKAPKPLVSGVELANFDKSVRPQDDFYRYVNGNWLKTAKIPADRAEYGSFIKLDEDSQARLRTIIEESSAKPQKAAGSDEQKVGDLYASFMNEKKLEELSLKPLEGELARIDAVQNNDQLASLFAHFGLINVNTPLGAYVNQDDKDPNQYIVNFFQSGLGLPDRDFYLVDDPKFKEIRQKYLVHVEKMLTLAGDKSAAAEAKQIMDLETALAKKYWTRVESRDADKVYNKYEIAKLKNITPAFNWDIFLKDSGITSPAVIVAQPSAFTGFGEQLQKTPLPVWKTYLKWHLISSYAQYLSKPFVDQDFDFYGKTLQGIEEQRPRWKRGVEAEQSAVGEVLGKIYVAKYFPPEAKARMEGLVKNLLKAYEQSIQSLDWMSDDTKKQALDKLAKFTPKIGYPNKWRDYSALSISADDLVGNMIRAAEFESHYQIGKLGKPIDRGEWQMTPQTVNAYYNPNMNEIVFPAAILQPPFFNMDADDAINYGGIGAVIGHEIGHGFDDQGSKYDGTGALKSWWTAEDRKKFEARTKALIDQYNQYEPIKGYKVNGALTIGENIGDLGGASIAYKAYQIALNGQPGPAMDGFSGDQRFFIGFAQVWSSMRRDELALERIKTDPHSPPEFRLKGVVVNVPQFYTAFDVKAGDAMFLAPEKRVKIW